MSYERKVPDLSAWTPQGRAQYARSRARAEARLAQPILPNRENTLTLGAEKVSVRRGGGSAQVPADELMMDMLIARALRGDLASAVELYARLDREEDIASANPVKMLSPYLQRRYHAILVDLLRSMRREAEALVDAGLAEWRNGKLVVAQIAREVHHAKSQAA